MPDVVETGKTYTPEEIERYTTYHWLQVDNPDGTIDAHVWRTIGGDCKYLGLADKHIAAGLEPERDLPLFPSLAEPTTPCGPTSAAGGQLPYGQGKEHEEFARRWEEETGRSYPHDNSRAVPHQCFAENLSTP